MPYFLRSLLPSTISVPSTDTVFSRFSALGRLLIFEGSGGGLNQTRVLTRAGALTKTCQNSRFAIFSSYFNFTYDIHSLFYQVGKSLKDKLFKASELIMIMVVDLNIQDAMSLQALVHLPTHLEGLS